MSLLLKTNLYIYYIELVYNKQKAAYKMSEIVFCVDNKQNGHEKMSSVIHIEYIISQL